MSSDRCINDPTFSFEVEFKFLKSFCKLSLVSLSSQILKSWDVSKRIEWGLIL